MSETNPVANIGDLAKPATVLIEKISDAIGGIFRPYQIRRVAEAEAHADRIRAATQIEITELQYRAMQRFFSEEAKKQANIESITSKAIENIKPDAQPQNVDDDWITHFFDNCRLVSDEEMQVLWAKLLAGEANRPGTVSKRTVSLLGSLDKNDAELFGTLCNFGWTVGDFSPLVYDLKHEVYSQNGITFSTLSHLDEIGLLSFNAFAGYLRIGLDRHFVVAYQGAHVLIEFGAENGNKLGTGYVKLSKSGQELARLCAPKPVNGFKEYAMAHWRSIGLNVTELPLQSSG